MIGQSACNADKHFALQSLVFLRREVVLGTEK